MRVLFLSHYFPPEVNAPASRTHENCKRWVREGHEVTVVTCAPNVPSGVVFEGYRNRPFQRETIDGIRVIRVWTFIAANEGTLLRSLNYLSYLFSATLAALFVRRPDVLVATSPQFFCGWAGVLVARLRRLPFVLEIRDLWPESIVAVGAMRQPLALRLLERLERRMYAAADRIVTVGEGYRERLLERGADGARIAIVMNGIDRERFAPRPPDAELARSLGLAGRFVCSYIGTIGMACGLDVVLRAAERLRQAGRHDIAFLLVGDGALRATLEREARERKLDNVVFTGRQPKERVPALLSISDACLIHLRDTPLFRTVMPSKIFEAAGMARPIVNGVRGEAARLVERAGAGISIDPEDAAALVRELERLAGDPELRRRLGQAGFDHVVRHFDRDVLARDYLRLLGDVAAPGRAPAGKECEP